MIDDSLVIGVTKIANKRYSQEFPLLGDNYFKSGDVRTILESLASILKEWEKLGKTTTPKRNK